jgi:hypothetical protein
VDAPNPKRWRNHYILWSAVTLIGGSLAVLALISAALWTASNVGNASSFSVPGQLVYDAATTDTVTIWSEVRGLGNIKGPGAKLASRPPADLKVRVVEQSTGNSIETDSASSLTTRTNTFVRQSIYEFTPPKPGKYVVSATGSPWILAVGSGSADRFLGVVGLSGCASCFGGVLGLLGVIMLIVTFVRHSASSKPPSRMPPQQPTQPPPF